MSLTTSNHPNRSTKLKYIHKQKNKNLQSMTGSSRYAWFLSATWRKKNI